MTKLTPEQKAALIKLAEAYETLSEVWDSSGTETDWNGPDCFGGVLEGLLPRTDLQDAAGELFHLAES